MLLYCMASYGTAWNCFVSYGIAQFSCCIVWYCMVVYYILRYCIVLHCWLRRAGCISQDTYLVYIYQKMKGRNHLHSYARWNTKITLSKKTQKYTPTIFLAELDHSKQIMCCHFLLFNFLAELVHSNKYFFWPISHRKYINKGTIKTMVFHFKALANLPWKTHVNSAPPPAFSRQKYWNIVVFR